MLSMGSRKELRELEALLVTHHRLDVILQLMTTSHEYLSEVSSQLLGGQVNIDTSADVTRSASLELLDPKHTLNLDSKAPQDGALYMTRMFKITYVISDPTLTNRYYVPIFTGPIDRVTRTGPILSVECLGKESLAFATVWNGRTYKKGLKKLDILRSIMVSAGEAPGKLSFPEATDAKIGTNLSANRKFTFWKLAKKIAQSMNMQLFYDGRGVLRLRRIPGKTSYTFQSGGALLTVPQIGYDTSELYNAVEVIGGKPKKAKNKIHYKMVAPKKHPLSPVSLGRNDTPRYLPLIIEDDSIKSLKTARAVAKKQLKGALAQAIEVNFDSLPIPHLEENDLARFVTEDSSASFRLGKMTIPLIASGASSVGYLRRVTPRRLRRPPRLPQNRR